METQVSTDGRIAKEISSSNITVNRVYKADYQKENSVTAELKQTVKTVSLYPSMSVSNDMKDNLFVPEDFGSKPKAYENNEGRVAWIDVPVGTTPEKLAELLTSNPTARLYKVLSNKPILTSDQKYAVQNGITTVDVIGSRQAIRYPENHDVVALR